MGKKKIGLILGKIAPFHKGHNDLIDTALSIVDELIFVVYDCPDRIHIPTNVRADWVRKQYPQVNVIEGWDAPNEHNDSDFKIQRKQENYISKILNGKKVTHFISAETYGEHMSKHLNAKNVVTTREKINISSTKIRENLYAHRNYVPNIVYRDLITKVAFIGFDWRSTNILAKMTAKKYETISKIFLKEPTDKTEMINILKKNKKEFSDESLIKEANTFAFYANTSLETYVLLQGVERVFSKDIRDEALKEMRDFNIIFLNQTNNKIINGVSSYFLNNQLKALLQTNNIAYIELADSHTKKEDKIKEVLYLNLKTKMFL